MNITPIVFSSGAQLDNTNLTVIVIMWKKLQKLWIEGERDRGKQKGVNKKNIELGNTS
jgi:hypothetical protein